MCVVAGTSYDFRFVLTNTTTPQAGGFDHPYYLTFLDLDAEFIPDGTGVDKAFREGVGVVGARLLRGARGEKAERGAARSSPSSSGASPRRRLVWTRFQIGYASRTTSGLERGRCSTTRRLQVTG
mgnify:CR=1 FL=1